jgi:pre-mRNA-splicing factor CWC26
MQKMKRKSEKTSTGHYAGVQSSESFAFNEKILRGERENEINELNTKFSGQNAETVYRDKHGKKLDMLSEFMRQQSNEENKKQKLEQAQYEWGLANVQKKEAVEALKELEQISSEPFARTIEDPRLEAMKKNELRDGDPMAEYFRTKKSKTDSTSKNNKTNIPNKPQYNGPGMIPNRFGIKPGYRWDAIDRGNGFEKKLLVMMSDKKSFKEDEYKWSVADL